MGYAKIASCDRCSKKRYVERINGKWLCLDCQDLVTEGTVKSTKASESAQERA
jgi:ribosomal protein L37AE/L43A